MTEEAKDVYIKKLVQSNVDQQNKICLLSKKVYQLEKANMTLEELKDRYNEEIELHQHAEDYIKSLEGCITKAKEILHKVCYEFGIYDKDLMEEAKQFLKDSEVEKMTINQIPTEERNKLCFDCEHCIRTIRGKECCLEKQNIYRDENTGILVCDCREENED